MVVYIIPESKTDWVNKSVLCVSNRGVDLTGAGTEQGAHSERKTTNLECGSSWGCAQVKWICSDKHTRTGVYYSCLLIWDLFSEIRAFWGLMTLVPWVIPYFHPVLRFGLRHLHLLAFLLQLRRFSSVVKMGVFLASAMALGSSIRVWDFNLKKRPALSLGVLTADCCMNRSLYWITPHSLRKVILSLFSQRLCYLLYRKSC